LFISETEIIVRYAETDRMGIVHHSNYPIWFEAARTDFIKNLECPIQKLKKEVLCFPDWTYMQIQRRGKIWGQAHCKNLYQANVLYEGNVLLRGFKCCDNSLITTGETVHAWTNKNLKPVNIKKHAPDIFELLNKAVL